MEIIPSLLVNSQEKFFAGLLGLGDCVRMLQIDIADGEFVPNVTWADPGIIAPRLRLECELHLMVKDPVGVAEKWRAVTQVKRVLFHYEASPDIPAVLQKLKTFGWEVSLVLNPETPLEAIEPYLSQIQGIMLMGIIPGFQGQPFIPATYERARRSKLMYPSHYLEIDGGVNENTIPGFIAAGVDAVCPGSAVFGHEKTPRENVARLQSLITGLTK
ncbi:MAG: Ribulose-phosphate 3-epimerase [Candidatus Magasanikbacteria bacterium GW2011_GWA2_56_11]|uniref:Ribulose-phosphate 3-epimerase n=1 Tax=Candidatus Magasanikbacteria bacterium GW2011_GWA2_56_11 TaxID=1619044 RepID=A0A0G1YHS7_9BACT|nr:MAG: Ribulose-phosphate 3-epimerase [Candidatus Magasanikbacteria bacterium GW2011_GWA2_56_11]